MFSRENHFIDCVSLQENKPFLIVVPGVFLEGKGQRFLQKFREKDSFAILRKKTFTSNCSHGYIDCTIDNPLEKFCRSLDKVSLKTR